MRPDVGEGYPPRMGRVWRLFRMLRECDALLESSSGVPPQFSRQVPSCLASRWCPSSRAVRSGRILHQAQHTALMR
jgi:hypothetical protein